MTFQHAAKLSGGPRDGDVLVIQGQYPQPEIRFAQIDEAVDIWTGSDPGMFPPQMLPIKYHKYMLWGVLWEDAYLYVYRGED